MHFSERDSLNETFNFIGAVFKPAFCKRFFRPVRPEVGDKREIIVSDLNIIGYFAFTTYLYDVHKINFLTCRKNFTFASQS